MRPTGRLHLGNYMGALFNWVRLQHEYDCYFFIADLHALTTDYADPTQDTGKHLPDHAGLSVGWARSGAVRDFQAGSDVLQHDRLNTLFGMFTPLGWLERVPSYKDQQQQLNNKDLKHVLGSSVSAVAVGELDILLYKPDFVPVGADQVAHVELTREVARRFNQLYPGELHALAAGCRALGA